MLNIRRRFHYFSHSVSLVQTERSTTQSVLFCLFFSFSSVFRPRPRDVGSLLTAHLLCHRNSPRLARHSYATISAWHLLRVMEISGIWYNFSPYYCYFSFTSAALFLTSSQCLFCLLFQAQQAGSGSLCVCATAGYRALGSWEYTVGVRVCVCVFSYCFHTEPWRDRR